MRSWYSAWIGESLVLELRASVFRHVLRQPLAFFTRTQTGALVSRMDGHQRDAAGGQGADVRVAVGAAEPGPGADGDVLAVVAAQPHRAGGGPLFAPPGKAAGKRAQRLLRQEMQLQGELSAMTAERTDVAARCSPCCTGGRRKTPGCSPQGQRVLIWRRQRCELGVVLRVVHLLAALVTALV